jgi:hypothetical protein
LVCWPVAAFGVVYAWGCGESGQLGHHSDNNVPLPKVVEVSEHPNPNWQPDRLAHLNLLACYLELNVLGLQL